MPHLKVRGMDKKALVENSKEIIDGLTGYMISIPVFSAWIFSLLAKELPVSSVIIPA